MSMMTDQEREEYERQQKAEREEAAKREAHNVGGKAGSATIQAYTGAARQVVLDVDGSGMTEDEGHALVTRVKNAAGIDEPPPVVNYTPQPKKKAEDHPALGQPVEIGDLGGLSSLPSVSGLHFNTVKEVSPDFFEKIKH